MKKGRKIRAAVDIEMILMISLSVAALFLIFNLFNTNLARITANKNINNLSPENTQRTQYKPIWDKDPTQTQVNVQIVGDHGLQWYHEQAQYTIESLITKPKNSLSGSELADLAKALTVFGESVPNGDSQSLKLKQTCLGAQSNCTDYSKSYEGLAFYNYDIQINWENGITSFLNSSTGTTIWLNSLDSTDARPNTPNASEEQRIKSIKKIKSWPFNS